MKFKLTPNIQDDEYTYKPEKNTFSLYQICMYPNSLSKKHGVRKLIYDENGTLLKYTENEIKKSVLELFTSKSKSHKYSLYPAFNVSNIEFPSENDILVAKSQILNN